MPRKVAKIKKLYRNAARYTAPQVTPRTAAQMHELVVAQHVAAGPPVVAAEHAPEVIYRAYSRGYL